MKNFNLDDVKSFFESKLGLNWKGEIMSNDIFANARNVEQIINEPVALKVFKGEKFGWFTFIISENQFKTVQVFTQNGQPVIKDGLDFTSKWLNFIGKEVVKNA